MKKRYIYFIISAIILIGLVFLIKYTFFDQDDSADSTDISELVTSKPLPIPPLLEDVNPDPHQAEFHLTAQEGKSNILDGVKSDTLGYNGDLLGPIIRVQQGEKVKVKMENRLAESTTLHWHGLRVDGEYDGGPHSVVRPGDTWVPEFTINQPAATLWYHPHMMQMTAQQVYEGLAGLMYIEDENSEKLAIPKEHGVDDFPLIIQDRTLDASGKMEYAPNMTDRMTGLHGNAFLINGAISPYLEVPQGVVRLRLLNGSNGRTYHFSLSNEQSFYQIASDGGFLEQPVELSSITLSAAERAEILVDFSSLETNEKVQLMNTSSDTVNATSAPDNEGDKKELMAFVVSDSQSNVNTIPQQLTHIEPIKPDNAVKTREFVMAGVGDRLTINDKTMDMTRVDELVDFDATEVWEVYNQRTGVDGGMAHPFHIHGTQFQILDRDGNAPPANESGWKDTVLIQPGERVRLITTFKNKGVFMYHCHILEHEDAGMMGQFEVK